jgi:hypothetical protein
MRDLQAPRERRKVMARQRSALRQIQRDAYLVSRTAGDLSAAQRGPGVLAKRLARRDLTRTLFRVLRGFGK